MSRYKPNCKAEGCTFMGSSVGRNKHGYTQYRSYCGFHRKPKNRGLKHP